MKTSTGMLHKMKDPKSFKPDNDWIGAFFWICGAPPAGIVSAFHVPVARRDGRHVRAPGRNFRSELLDKAKTRASDDAQKRKIILASLMISKILTSSYVGLSMNGRSFGLLAVPFVCPQIAFFSFWGCCLEIGCHLLYSLHSSVSMYHGPMSMHGSKM